MPQPPSRETDDDTPTAWDVYSTQILADVIAAVLGIGTVFYHYLEDWGWFDSLYFSVITLTTVGYGDLAPSTRASKLFTMVYLAVGISLLGAVVNEMMKRRQRHRRARRASR